MDRFNRTFLIKHSVRVQHIQCEHDFDRSTLKSMLRLHKPISFGLVGRKPIRALV
jgi:hypothetical protein